MIPWLHSRANRRTASGSLLMRVRGISSPTSLAIFNWSCLFSARRRRRRGRDEGVETGDHALYRAPDWSIAARLSCGSIVAVMRWPIATRRYHTADTVPRSSSYSSHESSWCS